MMRPQKSGTWSQRMRMPPIHAPKGIWRHASAAKMGEYFGTSVWTEVTSGMPARRETLRAALAIAKKVSVV
jgi:hypothetical protein